MSERDIWGEVDELRRQLVEAHATIRALTGTDPSTTPTDAPIAVGKRIRAPHWDDGRFVLVTAAGAEIFVGKECGEGEERAYFVAGEDWQRLATPLPTVPAPSGAWVIVYVLGGRSYIEWERDSTRASRLAYQRAMEGRLVGVWGIPAGRDPHPVRLYS